MVHEIVLFIMDASMAATDMNGGTGKYHLSYAQEAMEEIIYHYLTKQSSNQYNHYEVGVLSYLPSMSTVEEYSIEPTTLEKETDAMCFSSRRRRREESVVRFVHPSVSFLQSLHTIFRKRSMDSSSSNHVDTIMESYVEMEGSYIEGLFLAAEIFKEKEQYGTNKRTKTRFKIILLTDATEKLSFDTEKIDETLLTLREIGCTLMTIGFDFLHKNVHEFAMEVDFNEDTDDNGISPDIARQNPIQYENELFIISLTRVIGGKVFPVKCRRTLQQAIKRIVSSCDYQHPSSKKAIELILAPNLSISTRMSLLVSKNTLPSLKKEVILLDSETGEEMIDGAGEYITGNE